MSPERWKGLEWWSAQPSSRVSGKLGAQLVLMATEYDDEERLLCRTPVGDFREPGEDDGEHVFRLVEQLRRAGLAADGCFNCRYFTRSGMQLEAGGTAGYCLEGRMGQHVRPTTDITTLSASCDAHTPATFAERLEHANQWARSIGRPGTREP